MMLDAGGRLMTGDQLTPLLARLHDADDRIAMGLPQQIVDRLPVESRDCVGDLVGTSPEVLADIVEDGSASQPRRFFSGQLLALLGDPRIRPDVPVMVDIPAATVYVGLHPRSVDSVLPRRAPHGLQQDWLLQECPRHQVHIKAFRLMRYPITNCEYHRFLADTEYSALPTSWRFGRYPHELANHPVWSVDEAAASMYASWLSQRLGRRFRLPTEAEWEYAACGGDGRKYPWGNEFDPDTANTVETGPLSTTPVGMYPAGRSVFGVDDLSGNVEEFGRRRLCSIPGRQRGRGPAHLPHHPRRQLHQVQRLGPLPPPALLARIASAARHRIPISRIRQVAEGNSRRRNHEVQPVAQRNPRIMRRRVHLRYDPSVSNLG